MAANATIDVSIERAGRMAAGAIAVYGRFADRAALALPSEKMASVWPRAVPQHDVMGLDANSGDRPLIALDDDDVSRALMRSPRSAARGIVLEASYGKDPEDPEEL